MVSVVHHDRRLMQVVMETENRVFGISGFESDRRHLTVPKVSHC